MSSSPPSSPLIPGHSAKKVSYDYAHVCSSPQLDPGTIYSSRADSYEDSHGLWPHRLAAPHTHVKFQLYPASAYLPRKSFTYRYRYNPAPSPDCSEGTDTGFDDGIRSGHLDYLSDQDDQMEDGFSFSELGIPTISFRTSAERGRWKTDPIPQRSLPPKIYESATNEQLTGRIPTSEITPSIPTPTCPSRPDKQKQRDPKPEVISSVLPSPAPTSPLVLSGRGMGEESELPPLTSDRDSSMDVDEPVSELLTPSSPLPPSSSPSPFPSSPACSPLLKPANTATNAAYAQTRMEVPPTSALSSPVSSPPAYSPPFLSSPLSPISSEIGEDSDIDVRGKQIVLLGANQQETGSCDDVDVVVAQGPSMDQQTKPSSISVRTIAVPYIKRNLVMAHLSRQQESNLTPTLHACDHSLTCTQSQSTGGEGSIMKSLPTQVDAQVVTSQLPYPGGLSCQSVKCTKSEEREEGTLTSIRECWAEPVKRPSSSPVPVFDQQLPPSLSSAAAAAITTTFSELTAAASIIPLGSKSMTSGINGDEDEDDPAYKILETSEDVFLTAGSSIISREFTSVPVVEEEQEEVIVNAKRKVSTSVTQKRWRKGPTSSQNLANSAPLSHDNTTDLTETRMKKPAQQRRKRKYIIEESSSPPSNSNSDSDSDAVYTHSLKAKSAKTGRSERHLTGHTYLDDDGIPRDSNGVPLADSEICGMIIEGMATSRASSLPISQICRIVLQSRPAMKQKSEKEWGTVFERVLRSGSRVLVDDSGCGGKAGKRVEKGRFGNGSGVFGKVDSSYRVCGIYVLDVLC